MSIDTLRKLRDLWRSKLQLKEALNSEFDCVGFTSAYVQRCKVAADRGLAVRKTKYVKDSVWGMVELDWRAVRLLDAPILQRLRGIKQLGFTYLTYPTAEHTRFVHSIGMSAVVESFLTSVDRRASDKPSPDNGVRFLSVGELAPIKREDLVHAALLHDVGHMPFSHASEFAFEGHPDLFTCGGSSVADFLYDVERTIDADISLSEAISLLIILSERFEDFYLNYVRPGEEDPDSILRISSLIAGLAPTEELTGVAELISSGAIDADKIDYVNRDARACGIPVGVDVARVFLRSGFLDADQRRLIDSGLKESQAKREALFIVNASGVDTLDEITQARAALYQRVYLHPVTRASEAMLTRCLEENAKEDTPVKAARLADALSIWSKSDDELLADLSTLPSVRAKGYAQALRIRALPKKACVFSASISDMLMPLKHLIKGLDKTKADDIRKLVVNSPLERLDAKSLSKGKAYDLERRIITESAQLAEILKRGSHTNLVPSTELQSVILIGTSYMDKTRKDCIVLQDGELLRTSEFTNVRETQDALEIFKAVGFVMSEPDWAPIVAIAARSVLATPHDLLMPVPLNQEREITVRIQERMIIDLSGLYRRSGVKRATLNQVVEAASECGYFDSKPFLAPRLSVDHKGVREIAEKLNRFDGELSWRVGPETVASYLSQFPARLRDQMIEALKATIFFDNVTLVEGILSLLTQLDSNADVVGLSPSSGSALITALRNAAKNDRRLDRFRLRKDLREALSEPSTDPLVLVDDIASSGVQASAQLLSWAGVERESWPIECQKEDNIFTESIEADRWQRLATRPIHLYVCAGRAKARSRIADAATKAGIKKFVGVNYAQSIEETYKWPEPLEAYLTEVGLHLIAWARHEKMPDKLTEPEKDACKADAFGYGNAGGLVVTATNVPTSTATALWCPGMHSGAAWMPLVIRQKKIRHLVLA